MWIRNLYEQKDIALRLPPRFDAARLQDDLRRIDPGWWEGHLSDYHDGNWQSISLWAPGGSRRNQFSHGGEFGPTEAMRLCEYVPEVVESLPGRKNRVRLLRLRPGGEIYPHSDPLHQITRDLVRLHIPIVTNPDVDFRVHGAPVAMQPGETWFVDVRFRHGVRNAGSTDRVHLVVDVVASEELRRLMGQAQSLGKGYLTGYFLKHALGKRVVRLLGIGN
jgi:quercetin dioxygenase-like cupin family protein